MGAFSKLLQGSLFLRHGTAIMRCRLPWHQHFSGYDDITELTELDKFSFREKLIAMDTGEQMGTFALDQVHRFERFNSHLILPSPSEVSEPNSHFIQAMACPSEKRGWLSLFVKKDKKFTHRSLITFDIEIMKSANLKNLQFFPDTEISDENVWMFQGGIGATEAALLEVKDGVYVPGDSFGIFSQSETFKSTYANDNASEALLKKYKYALPMANGEPREVFLAKNIHHPSMRRLRCAWIGEDNRNYASFDLYKWTLNDYLNERTFDLKESMMIFTTVTKGVLANHSMKVLHLDIAPDNIFINGLDVVLGDLGIGLILEGDRCDPPGMKLFNSTYAAPELLRDVAITTAADIFTLGLILFVLCIRCNKRDEREAKVLELKELRKSPAWKANPRAAWYGSSLSKDFEGEAELLIDMLSSTNSRPTAAQVIDRINNKGAK